MTTEFEIKKIEEKDFEDLEVFKGKVWQIADKEHYPDKMPDFQDFEITYIARENNVILGYIEIHIDTGVAKIENLMVEKKGKGIGSKILKYIENELKKINIHKIWLETGDLWKSKNFYIKNGYTKRAILPNHHGNQDFILFDKML